MTNCAIFIISTGLYELPLCLEKLPLLCKCRHVPLSRDRLIAVEETSARLADSGICLRTCLSCCWPIQTSFSKMSMTSQHFILLFFPTFFPWTIAGLLASRYVQWLLGGITYHVLMYAMPEHPPLALLRVSFVSQWCQHLLKIFTTSACLRSILHW